MRLPAALCKIQRKKRETDGFSKSTWMTLPGSHPTSGFGTRHGLPKFFGHKKRRIVQNDAAKTKISPVDIPTGRDPRTKQQPTGLIAYPACGRPCCSNPSRSQSQRVTYVYTKEKQQR